MLAFGGSHVAKSGLLNQIHQLLSNAGIALLTVVELSSNPRLELAQKKAVELGKREGVDFILAIGGGLSWILLRRLHKWPGQ